MKIRKMMLPADQYSQKSPYKMTPRYIVIHNTYNSAPAINEIAYMIRNDAQLSYHYAVDEVEAIQALPLNRNGWHAGDGGNGKGNRYGIGIEICRSRSDLDLFKKAEINGAKLTAMLLDQFNWGIEKVTKHQDYSGKYCPHRTLSLGWKRFLNMVQKELDALQKDDTPTASKPAPIIPKTDAFKPFTVEVTTKYLNIRKGAGNSYAVVGQTGKGVFTIVELSKSGNWGKLKSGLGWIYLPLTTRLDQLKDIKSGDKVKIIGSRYATDQVIPKWVKAETHTVLSVKDSKALLKEINSYVYLQDLKKV